MQKANLKTIRKTHCKSFNNPKSLRMIGVNRDSEISLSNFE